MDIDGMSILLACSWYFKTFPPVNPRTPPCKSLRGRNKARQQETDHVLNCKTYIEREREKEREEEEEEKEEEEEEKEQQQQQQQQQQNSLF